MVYQSSGYQSVMPAGYNSPTNQYSSATDPYAANFLGRLEQKPSGSVLGATTTNTGGTYTGGATQQTSGSAMTASNPYENVQPTGPSQQEIDASFNPILDVYNQAESNLRGQLPGLISEAEAQAKVSQGLLSNQRMGANELLGQQEQQTTTQQQRLAGQQRQTLQELQLANQQRFGGASSAGLAAGELQGREYQRSQFGIQENAQQALQAIGQQRQVVEREYNQGLQQLEVNRQQAVNDINRKFQDRMLEINARRGETESAKAQARMSALQELRNQAYQINVAKAQFEADLRSQAQQNTAYLSQVEQQYTGATNAGQQAAGQYGAYQATGIPQVNTQTTGSSNPQLVGQVSRQEDNPTGQIFTPQTRGYEAVAQQVFQPYGLPTYR